MSDRPLPRVRCWASVGPRSGLGRCRRLAPVSNLGLCHRHWAPVLDSLLREAGASDGALPDLREQLRRWAALVMRSASEGGPHVESGTSAVRSTAPGHADDRALEPDAAPRVMGGLLGTIGGDMASREPTPMSRRLRGSQKPLTPPNIASSNVPDDGDRECTPEEEAEAARLAAELGVAV